MLEGAEILQQLLRSDHFYISDPANFILTTDSFLLKSIAAGLCPTDNYKSDRP